VHLRRKEAMYKSEDRKTQMLFKELFPFGGQLDRENEWIKLSEMIPWVELEEVYGKYFSQVGRPAKEGRLITGLMIIRHKKGYSDREAVKQLMENPYLQYFCGFEHFVTKEQVHPSLLSKKRKALGRKYFEIFESEMAKVLIERGIVRIKKAMFDGTVFPSDIEYPTDVKLLNRAREWIVGHIVRLRKVLGIGEKIRTYRRCARRAYLNFSKNRRKTKAVIKKTHKKMLRYVKRNIRQLEVLLEEYGRSVRKELRNRFETVKQIYRQQKELAQTGVRSIQNRIVSLHQPYVRPIKRGKDGKDVEFGPKGSVSYVDGYMFLDKLSFEAFNEASVLKENLKEYKRRFGRLPEEVIADQLYGSRWNRRYLNRLKIKGSFKMLGRPGQEEELHKKLLRQKQKERNRIEGIIGHGKNHYGMGRIRYRTEEGAFIWVVMGMIAMNLTTALRRI